MPCTKANRQRQPWVTDCSEAKWASVKQVLGPWDYYRSKTLVIDTDRQLHVPNLTRIISCDPCNALGRRNYCAFLLDSERSSHLPKATQLGSSRMWFMTYTSSHWPSQSMPQAICLVRNYLRHLRSRGTAEGKLLADWEKWPREYLSPRPNRS